MHPVAPDYERFPDGRDLKVCDMEIGLAGAWLKRSLHNKQKILDLFAVTQNLLNDAFFLIKNNRGYSFLGTLFIIY